MPTSRSPAYTSWQRGSAADGTDQVCRQGSGIDHGGIVTVKQRRPLGAHPDVLGDPTRGDVLRMNKRDQARDFEATRCCGTSHGRCFRGHTLVPEPFVNVPSNLDLLDSVEFQRSDTAVPGEARAWEKLDEP